MSYFYTAQEMKKELEVHPKYREKLYCRGFLLTNGKKPNLSEYPFYSNWNEIEITSDSESYRIYTHKEAYCHLYKGEKETLFLIGHAYDPFTMLWKEEDILKSLYNSLQNGWDSFWDAESNLTGVFCIGVISGKKVVFSTDCAGMQMVYYGTHDGDLYVTSHSKLVGDMLGYSQDPYITKVTNTKFWHYWGTYLPGDCSPYKELRRNVPNFCVKYNKDVSDMEIERYFPLKAVVETTTEEEYQKTIHELSDIMSNTMKLVAKKWPDKKAAISVTGGRDSMTTVACSNGIYDQFGYFSYISNVDESVDAYAAKQICEELGVEHSIIEIPQDDPMYKDLDTFKKILECNAGCIGANNENDARKRLYFSNNPPCEMEIKSWVNEMGRAWSYNKYNKKSFPKYPKASYIRSMHKLYLNPSVIKDTDKVFADYLKKYYSKEVFDNLSWLELFSWELAWSSGEGMFLTAEHRISYDITVPFNNRKYVAMMLTVPVSRRVVDDIPKDIISYKQPIIAKTGVVIKDISHTNMRALMVRAYLEVFSKIRFSKEGREGVK